MKPSTNKAFSDLQGLEKLPDGTYKVRDKLYGIDITKWEGEVIEIGGKIFPHGEGHFFYKNGEEIEKEMQSLQIGNDFYTGECKNGKPHGKGTYIWADGTSYDGEWKDGKRHGEGKYTFADGYYIGKWIEDEQEGDVTFNYKNGNVYEGEWIDGKPHGKGTMNYQSRNVYKGEWVNGMRQGKGTNNYTMIGWIYEGEWKDDKVHGKGKMIYTNSTSYEGEWVNGNKQGDGKFTFPDGTYYTGNWTNNRQKGDVTYTYSNGNVYKGGWENNKPHGQGKLTFPNGDYYEGGWQDGKQEGEGLTFASGVSYKGKFENGFAIDFSEIIITDSKKKSYTITKENGLYFYPEEGKEKQEIDIENEKRLESVLLQFGNSESNQEDVEIRKDPEELQKFIESKIIESKIPSSDKVKPYIVRIPGHAFVMFFEKGKAYCFDDGSIKKSKKWYDVIKKNKVEYVDLPHEPNLKFHLKDGSPINIPIETDAYICRHKANVVCKILAKLSEKLKKNESLFDKFIKYSEEVAKENKSLPDRVDKSLTKAPDKKPKRLIRINSRDDLSPPVNCSLKMIEQLIGSDNTTQDESKLGETPENLVQVNQNSSNNCFMRLIHSLTSCCGGTTTRL